MFLWSCVLSQHIRGPAVYFFGKRTPTQTSVHKAYLLMVCRHDRRSARVGLEQEAGACVQSEDTAEEQRGHFGTCAASNVSRPKSSRHLTSCVVDRSVSLLAHTVSVSRTASYSSPTTRTLTLVNWNYRLGAVDSYQMSP